MDMKRYDALMNELNPYRARLIAVSKTKPAAAVMELYRHGHRDFGENKVQELLQKRETLPKDIRWHLIGHLQSNKVKLVVPFVAMIHSVDSLKLLCEIDKQAAKVNRVVDCLLQIHIAAEETKFGLSKTEVEDLLCSKEYRQMKHVRICGLMGIATNTDNEVQVRNEFECLKSLFDSLKAQYFSEVTYFQERSMGMSADYRIALPSGATMIRIGSALFGERDYSK